jgi:hypothetical protein
MQQHARANAESQAIKQVDYKEVPSKQEYCPLVLVKIIDL